MSQAVIGGDRGLIAASVEVSADILGAGTTFPGSDQFITMPWATVRSANASSKPINGAASTLKV